MPNQFSSSFYDIMSGLFRLLKSKFDPPHIPSGTRFDGQTIVITGVALGGLGYEAALHFVILGAAKVIITARNMDRGNVAKDALEASSGRTGVVKVRELDMDTFDGVKTFSDGLKSELTEVDYVLLNAGVFQRYYAKSPEGWEESLQVNVLSTTFLALLLLPWMKANAPVGRTPHLGIVTSGLHTSATVDSVDSSEGILEYYDNAVNFTGKQYGISKLFAMYAVEGLTAIAAQPTPGNPK